MSNFMFLEKINNDLFKLCIEAEQLANTQPRTAANIIRQALEAFTYDVLKNNSQGLDLYGCIEKLNDNRTVPQNLVDKMHEIRKALNKNVHYKKRGRGDIKQEVPRNISSYEVRAFLKTLFDVTLHYYSKFNELKTFKFDANLLPIGNYKIIEELPLRPTEIVCNKKYRAWKVNPDTGVKEHAIIRRYNSDFIKGFELEFRRRDLRALQARWTEDPPPQNIVRYDDIQENKSENLFIAFFISEDAKLLSQFAYETLCTTDKIDIAYSVANGIYELHNMDNPIAHRMLTPDSIYVFMKKGRYMAKLCNFEYAKLMQVDVGTVIYFIRKVTEKYKAPELGANEDNREIEYQLTDIYSLGKIFLELFSNCQEKNDIGQKDQIANNDLTLISTNLSSDFNRTIKKMISQVPHERPSIEYVLEVIKKEMELTVKE